MEWAAMVLSMVGVVLYLKPTPRLVVISLACYAISSLLWALVGFNIGMLPLIISNILFVIIETYACYKWYVKYWKSDEKT